MADRFSPMELAKEACRTPFIFFLGATIQKGGRDQEGSFPVLILTADKKGREVEILP
jgi:hypothetical protein